MNAPLSGGDMTAARIAAVFTRTGPSASSSMYVGDGILRCGICKGVLQGGHLARQSYPDPSGDYFCPSSAHPRLIVPVRGVDRELQEMTLQRLREPQFVAEWRRVRARELDDAIAQALAIRAWTDVAENRQELNRLLRTENRFREFVSRMATGEDLVQHDLDQLARDTVDLVTERATFAVAAVASRNGPRLVDLRQAYYEYLRIPRPYYRRELKRAYARALGLGLGDLKLHRKELEGQLWELLAESGWQDPGPEQRPAMDPALAQDWARSPTTMVRRRQELLLMAIGEDRLLIGSASDRPLVRRLPGPS